MSQFYITLLHFLFFFFCVPKIILLKNNCIFRWLWSEAGTQPELESSLEIGGFGYPALAVLNVKKMKYSILRGSFSEEGIKEFLRYVLSLLKNYWA